jgi:lysozyme family protein
MDYVSVFAGSPEMSNFDTAFTQLLGSEGSYSNHPDDPGGETMWGITIKVARLNGYDGNMKDMPVETAKAIYRKHYWLPAFDDLPYAVAFQVFDGAVNSGVAQSVKWLQRAVGVANDGNLGPATMAAVKAADPLKTAVRYNVHRLQFMRKLGGWGAFSRGWAERIANNLELAVRAT